MPPTIRTQPQAVTRAYDAQIDSIDKTNRSLVGRINTSGIDRFHTVIDPKGAKLENYRRNPVVCWEHGKDPRRFTDPIGRNLWIRSSGGEHPTEILAKTQFLEDDFSQQRYEWYRDGVLNAFSVHALPLEGSPPTKEELRARPELNDCQYMYRSWELAEYSATVVPGNADTLTAGRAAQLVEAVERGLWLPDDLRPIIEAKARTMTDSLGGLSGGGATVPATRYIKHEGKKWIVYSESGKPLGEHDNEEDAKKQLGAIEANKHKDRGQPYIEVDDAGSWLVRGIDGELVLATQDQQVAEQCLLALGQIRTFEQSHHAVTQEFRTAFHEFKEDITAILDLMIHGRV